MYLSSCGRAFYAQINRKDGTNQWSIKFLEEKTSWNHFAMMVRTLPQGDNARQGCDICNKDFDDVNLYFITCSICVDQLKYCATCVSALCSTRTLYQLDSDPAEPENWKHFVVKGKQKNIPCPICKNDLISEYKSITSNGDTHHLPLPYGWIGERAFKQEICFEQTEKIYQAIVKPFVDALLRHCDFYFKKVAQKKDYIATMQRQQNDDTNRVAIQFLDGDIETLARAIQFFKNKALEKPWISEKRMGFPAVSTIPMEDIALAQAINSGQSPSINAVDSWINQEEDTFRDIYSQLRVDPILHNQI